MTWTMDTCSSGKANRSAIVSLKVGELESTFENLKKPIRIMVGQLHPSLLVLGILMFVCDRCLVFLHTFKCVHILV